MSYSCKECNLEFETEAGKKLHDSINHKQVPKKKKKAKEPLLTIKGEKGYLSADGKHVIAYLSDGKSKKLSDLERESKSISKSLVENNLQLKSYDNFFEIEKRKNYYINKNIQIKKKLDEENIKLKKFNSILMSAISEFEKVASEKEKNTQSINRLESKVSFYSSLGFNKTEKKLIKDIIVNENYKLSFYLALGDGIEASKDKKSDVTWNTSKSKEKLMRKMHIQKIVSTQEDPHL